MAQPTNTYDSYDMNGIKEDLADVIYDVSPSETPFLSAIAKTKAANTYHEWQTNALRSASTSNAHIEGDETTATAVAPTTRLGSYTQIFKDAIRVSGTDDGLKKAGRGKEMAYAILRAGKTLKLDMEATMFNNQARVAGNSTTARQLAGVPAWLTSNVEGASDGAVATGDGTDTYTDGTQEAFTQARFDAAMQSAWENGGTPSQVYLSAYNMGVAVSGFNGMNNQRSTIGAAVGGNNSVVNALDVYVTSFGTVEFVPSRNVRSRDVFIIDPDMWAMASLRNMKNEALAKTGDSEARQIVAEATLVCRNEAGNAFIADNTTSA